jgi:nucleoid-associated protein YejK
VGLRETINFKYGATDFYFVCVLTCEGEQSVAVEDVAEVSHAEWVDLDKITEFNNDNDLPEIWMYQTPFEFVTRIKQQLKLRPEGQSVHSFMEETNWAGHY